jgi:hypothetical protein
MDSLQTGGGSGTVKDLSDLEKRALFLIGPESVDGVDGVKESLSFTAAQVCGYNVLFFKM